MMTHWNPSFFIPFLEDLPDLAAFSFFSSNLASLCFRFATNVSEDLCYGASLIISSKQAIFSSIVLAAKNLFSAEKYSGPAFTVMILDYNNTY